MNFEISPKETEIQASWVEAKMYCFSLGEGWRLPTLEELFWIRQSTNDYEDDWYWSSTEQHYDRVFIRHMKNDYHYSGTKNGGNFYVRAIREKNDN